ncbi:MAG: hypothetical protein FWC95_00605 [Defluviitaleaceae bacterium]|nr:hypothetical protein [Defluviitaleaceae bacterium]
MEYTCRYKYYCQQHAERIANTILPIPEDYPLASGLPIDFSKKFTQFCELAKSIYRDIAKNPEGYGCKLVPVEEIDSDVIKAGNRTVSRAVDTLFALFKSAHLHNNTLTVPVQDFLKQIKGRNREEAEIQRPVPKYEKVLLRLTEFGFVFSNFNGKPFSKNIETFDVEYPDDPVMMNTMKLYFECWDTLWFSEIAARLAVRKIKSSSAKSENSPFEGWQAWFHFDYKITADRAKIPLRQWVVDNIHQTEQSRQMRDFAITFYDYSTCYPDIKFNIANAAGEYFYKSARIARTLYGRLSLKLPKVDKSMSGILAMPDTVRNEFKKDHPGCCNKVKGGGNCTHSFKWKFDGVEYCGCPQQCFLFDDLRIDLVPGYWELLKLQYNLRQEVR